jgi:hypothetical protein
MQERSACSPRMQCSAFNGMHDMCTARQIATYLMVSQKKKNFTIATNQRMQCVRGEALAAG